VSWQGHCSSIHTFRTGRSSIGSVKNFEKALERRLLLRKYLTEKIAPKRAGQKTAYLVVNRWMQNLSGNAMVRIALFEQVSNSHITAAALRGIENGSWMQLTKKVGASKRRRFSRINQEDNYDLTFVTFAQRSTDS
jgi:hypothetical protein